MNISSIALSHRAAVALLAVLTLVGGLIAFARMPVQNTPDIEVPVVLVAASLPGASPAQLETEVARRMEGAVAGLGRVRHVSTILADGRISMSVEFRAGQDPVEALAQVRDALVRERGELPAALTEPVLSRPSDADSEPLLTFALVSERLDLEALSWRVDQPIARALMRLPGVGSVRRVGGASRELLIELDPLRMAAQQVSPAVLSQLLSRVQQEAPSGRAGIGGMNQLVRTLGPARSVAEVAAMELALPDGRSVRLDQVARVTDTVAEPTTQVWLDGRPAVAFQVMRSRGAGDLDTAARVRSAVAGLGLPAQGVQVQEVLSRAEAVRANYRDSLGLIAEGALLTVLVVWLFLRDWRATLVSAVALPLSVVPTFLVMHLLGFTLNLVTLLALALVIGLLVDDAIVEVENIMRHLRAGKTARQAVVEATEEIGLSVVATSLVLVAVFLPTAFMNDVAGQFFRQFGWTASSAVLASLVVARLITPTLAALLLRPSPAPQREPTWQALYLRLARWSLRRRRLTLAAALGFFVISLALVGGLQTAFIPAADGEVTEVTIDLAPGSRLQDTRAAAEQARQLLLPHAAVRQVYTQVGDGSLTRATLSVRLPPRSERAATQQQINADLRARLATLPNARVKVADGDAGDELVLQLASQDPVALETAARALQAQIRALPGLGYVHSDAALVRPELTVTPDLARAVDLGVNPDDIAQALRVATAGDYDQALARLNLPDRQVPIRVRLPETARQDLAQLAALPLPGRHGLVPLGAVARLRLDGAAVRIERRDGARRVVLRVGLAGQDESEVMARVQALPALQALPPGVVRERLGDAERTRDLLGHFFTALGLGLLSIYLVLVLLLRQLLQPLTVMVALPLSLGGAFVALLAAGSTLSMPSLIGVLMLMGLSGKNSILLVDHALRLRRNEGRDAAGAMLEAARLRVRPIVMTSFAMAAGMLPIALGFSADASFRAPMAIAVIGGIVTSTVLSLLVIPVVFCVAEDARDALHRRLLRWRGLATVEAAAGPVQPLAP